MEPNWFCICLRARSGAKGERAAEGERDEQQETAKRVLLLLPFPIGPEGKQRGKERRVKRLNGGRERTEKGEREREVRPVMSKVEALCRA